uniref:Uncharacterized protein n=1 Tax=Biomphalaria glabrata TaxID=6526 RepID=A0A2C9K4T4_BIOGL
MSITQTSSKESNIGLISDEERAALGKVRLEDDVSESSVGTETKTPSLVVEKQVAKFIGPPIPVNRDGMGRYVVPPNGRPLTFNDKTKTLLILLLGSGGLSPKENTGNL